MYGCCRHRRFRPFSRHPAKSRSVATRERTLPRVGTVRKLSPRRGRPLVVEMERTPSPSPPSRFPFPKNSAFARRTESSNPSPSSGESANYRFLSGQERMQACGVPSTALTRRPGPRPRPSGSRPPNGSIRPFSETLPRAVRHLQSLSRRRALPFSSFSVSSGPSGNVFSHSVPGRFSANG